MIRWTVVGDKHYRTEQWEQLEDLEQQVGYF